MNFLWGKVQPVLRHEKSTALVVPSVKVRMEAQHSVLFLSLHALLRESYLHF
jgi:hypothetical protein